MEEAVTEERSPATCYWSRHMTREINGAKRLWGLGEQTGWS